MERKNKDYVYSINVKQILDFKNYIGSFFLDFIT